MTIMVKIPMMMLIPAIGMITLSTPITDQSY